MIHIDKNRNGYSVSICFDEVSDSMVELAYVIQSVKKRLCDGMPEEVADRVITTSAKLAYAESDDAEVEAMKEFSLWLEENVEELKTKEGQ